MVFSLILVNDSSIWLDLLVYATVAVTIISGIDAVFGVKRTVEEAQRAREARAAAKLGE
jgi:CDP-diacylglycerol--glycerol-3-phosphate 3-phosphatidyltransferase